MIGEENYDQGGGFDWKGLALMGGIAALVTAFVFALAGRNAASQQYDYKDRRVNLLTIPPGALPELADAWRFEIRHLRSSDRDAVIASGGPFETLEKAREAADQWLKENVG